MRFREFKVFIKMSLKFVPKGPIDNKPAIRRQAIIWTSAYPIHWRIYAALGEVSQYWI